MLKTKVPKKKQVRISAETVEKTIGASLQLGIQDGDWSDADLEQLRKAHKRADPQSVCFWEDVSDQLGEHRSASECREKWFSLVKTPVPTRRRKRQEFDDESVTLAADDIFNATPMKKVVASLEDDKGIKGISQMEIKESAIKIKRKSNNDEGADDDIGGLPEHKASSHNGRARGRAASRVASEGYKTYLQSMRRTMKRELKVKKKKKATKCYKI